MATNDVKIARSPYSAQHPTRTYLTEAATSIKAGEPVKRGGTGGNFAVRLATGDPEITADLVLGIAATDSTDTAAAAGEVLVYEPLPGTVYRCAATTPANLADGILLDRVAFDLTGTVYTVDEDEGDNVAHGLVIVGYDSEKGTVDFEIRAATTLNGNSDV